VVLGLYIIRGDNMSVSLPLPFPSLDSSHRAIVGELDEDIDSRMDLSEIRAAPLKPLTH
jgi:U6 snRNA-associated Sm-like protein LSm8